jgi:DNA-binding XRE family transcriptional regulator
MDIKEFAKLTPQELKNMRKKIGLKQNKIAELLGVTAQAIYYIEAGTNKSAELKMKMVLLYEILMENVDKHNK